MMSNAGDHVVQKLQMWVFMYSFQASYSTEDASILSQICGLEEERPPTGPFALVINIDCTSNVHQISNGNQFIFYSPNF